MLPAGRPPSKRQPSSFQTRTATDEAGELNRRWTRFFDDQPSPSPAERPKQRQTNSAPEVPRNPYQPDISTSTPPTRVHSFTKRLLHINDGPDEGELDSALRKRTNSDRRKAQYSNNIDDPSWTVRRMRTAEDRKTSGEQSTPKPGLGPRPVGGHEKLGTFSGVFVPTCLNVLSILMFLRFGFILGQGGVIGIMGMFNHSLTV